MRLLDRDQYTKAASWLKEVPFNKMFASDVVLQKIDGLVYADKAETPTSFYIVHPYGMSLLLGNCENEIFNQQLADYLLNKDQSRNKIDWMQVYPEGWSSKLIQLIGDKLSAREQKAESGRFEADQLQVEEHTRVNFKFNQDKFLSFKATFRTGSYDMRRTGETEFHHLPGTVVPKFFWKSAEQFLKQGVGFSIWFNNELASTAFSAYIDDQRLEIGIESAPQFRGRGFAIEVCSTLINYCLNNGYEPVWACRLENTNSYLLAQKLGFDPVLFLPFYRVKI